MKRIILMLHVLILSGLPAISNGDCGDGFGDVLGSFRGIEAKSNGEYYDCTWTGSGQWQCVEFVKRFYADEVGDAIEYSWGEARNAYDIGDPGLYKYAQGGTTMPQPGDVLCFDGGTYGHVAIVTEVGTNYVRMMDQNRTNSSSDIDIVLTLTVSDGHYTVGTFDEDYDVEGWLRDPDYIPSGVTAKFTDVVNRNGGSATVGNPSGNYYWYGPYVRRNYTGGTLGTCCIMYDPNNGRGNPQATNEAYLLRTGFYEYFTNNGGWQARGCPSRDEYHPETGAPNDAIQFFVRRLWNFETNRYDNIFHYMYWENATQSIAWHSSYQTDWVSQDPGGVTAMTRNETRSFTVKFKNTGTTTWYNNIGSYPYDYIRLKSTDPDGNAASSLLYGSGMGWIDTETPCTMQEASVAPGDTATFTFTGKVPSGQALGAMNVYFRPEHGVAGLLDGWDGMHFQVQVVPVYARYHLLTGDFNADGKVDVCLRDSTTAKVYVALSTGSAFQPSGCWLTWAGGGSQYKWMTGDFNGDGYCDIAFRDTTTAQIHIALSTGGSFAPTSPSSLWLTWAGGGSQYKWMTGDFNGDGNTDMCMRDTTTAQIHVALSTGSSFVPTSPSSLWLTWAGGGSQYKFLPGDFDGDGKDDINLRDTTTAQLHAALSTGSSFVPTSPSSLWLTWAGGGSQYKWMIGDCNGDGKADMSFRDTTTAQIHVALSTGTAFQPTSPSSLWLTWGGGGSEYEYRLVDCNGDGADDILLHSRETNELHVALSTGSSFVPTSPSSLWLSWGTPAPKVAMNNDGSAGVPTTFMLAQNYPNPFNPVTTIAYSLPAAAHVTLEVFNILGQRVSTLVDDDQAAGDHLATWDAARHASGVYLYRITTGEAVETKKMLLLK